MEGQRLVVPTHLLIDVCEPPIVSSRHRLQLDGLVQMQDGLIESARPVEDPAERRLDCRRPRIELLGYLDDPADLAVDDRPD